MEPPTTPLEAVTMGLYLAITAPTQKKAQLATQLTADLIVQTNLSEHEVDTAKALALAQIAIETNCNNL